MRYTEASFFRADNGMVSVGACMYLTMRWDWPVRMTGLHMNEQRDRSNLNDDLLVTLKSSSDERGALVSIENGSVIPFNIARVYYIFNTLPEVSRGFHAHVNLRQLAVCVRGTCQMILDNGMERRAFLLDNPTKGLLISSMIWREMHKFSEDAVLMVLADAAYDEADYIRSYDDFLSRVEMLR
jgi:dTDP-4-dehydrorhamnose 3,5-epimerase-like enzyme